jgi:hypothetical protein
VGDRGASDCAPEAGSWIFLNWLLGQLFLHDVAQINFVSFDNTSGKEAFPFSPFSVLFHLMQVKKDGKSQEK